MTLAEPSLVACDELSRSSFLKLEKALDLERTADHKIGSDRYGSQREHCRIGVSGVHTTRPIRLQCCGLPAKIMLQRSLKPDLEFSRNSSSTSVS